MSEREAFEAWWKDKCPVGGVNAKLAARDAWNARAAIEAQRVPDGWADAYSAFVGAFDNAVARRNDDSEYANDARRRLRAINEAMLSSAPPVAQPAERKPLSELHINQGSADAAADAYEADYWAARAQVKAELDRNRGALQAVSYYVRDAIQRMRAHGIGD